MLKTVEGMAWVQSSCPALYRRLLLIKIQNRWLKDAWVSPPFIESNPLESQLAHTENKRVGGYNNFKNHVSLPITYRVPGNTNLA